jgi:hypothetical protein
MRLTPETSKPYDQEEAKSDPILSARNLYSTATPFEFRRFSTWIHSIIGLSAYLMRPRDIDQLMQ